MRYVMTLLLVALLSSVASAAMSIALVEVDKGGILPTRITTDIMLTTDTDWLGAQLVILPTTTNKVYQDTYGNANPQSPDPGMAYGYWYDDDEDPETPPVWVPPINATLQYDTYVSNGVCGETVSLVAPVDLGYGVQIFNRDKIQQGWYTTDTDDIGTIRLARLTLTNTTVATWKLLVTAYPAGVMMATCDDGTITGGHMSGTIVIVPEPATIGLLVLGGLGVLLRRKR